MEKRNNNSAYIIVSVQKIVGSKIIFKDYTQKKNFS